MEPVGQNIIIVNNDPKTEWIDGQWKIRYGNHTYSIRLTDKDNNSSPLQYCERDSDAYRRQEQIAKAALAGFKKALESKPGHVTPENIKRFKISTTDKKMSLFHSVHGQDGLQSTDTPYTALSADLKETFSSAFKGALSCRFERPAAFPKLENNQGSLAAVMQATRVLKFYRNRSLPENPQDNSPAAQQNRSLHRVYQDLEGSAYKVPEGHLTGEDEGNIPPLLATIDDDKKNSPKGILEAISERNPPLIWEPEGEQGTRETKKTLLSFDVGEIPQGRSLQQHFQGHIERGSDGQPLGWHRQPPVVAIELKRIPQSPEKHHVPFQGTLDFSSSQLFRKENGEVRNRAYCQYNLKSFIAAKNPNSGPHIAYVKEGDRWFKCEEGFVISIQEDVVQEAFKQAHLCFYEPQKIEPQEIALPQNNDRGYLGDDDDD